MANTAQSPAYNLSPQIGPNFALIFTPPATTSSPLDGYENPPFQPGYVVSGTDGSIWEYVLAATVINLNDCVVLDAGSNASQITKALADTYSYRLGFACGLAIPSGSYGWVATQGQSLKVNVLTGTSANVALYTTASAGVLSSTSSSQDLITGVTVTTANASGSTASEPCVAINPRILQ